MARSFFQNGWDDQLQEQFEQAYYVQLQAFLKQAYEAETIYPPQEDLWTAFRLTPFQEVKVVILGQDPYHGEGQAHGLSFSVNEGVKIPPSLRNMFKELTTDIGCPMPQSGNLSGWATQGVLLLNAVLTVQQGQANSHRKKGWELFTDAVIQQLSAEHEHLVFILWGKPAQQKKALIDVNKHAIVESVHPSPLSAYRGFFGSAPYSKTNAHLTSWGKAPIRWYETNLTN